MLNYDFHNLLSPFEFECFSRDLINAHEGLDLASFAEGRDGGVDLRYTFGEGGTVIVQAKRYKDYNKLKSELKKERDKVKRLKPQRYILTTSVDLTDQNKQEIISLFNPFIKNENDILAKQDLNKILAQNPEIEHRYYKLWLASTSVLNDILNKNIVNWTRFEKAEIEETVRTYVMNNSFSEAFKKLIENRYVIISGEPGIGKTTLARVLVMHLLSNKFADSSHVASYDEFYYTNSIIDDLAKVMQPGKRQVFFYDDFLGQITLEEGEKNFDSRIVSFIKACQREGDKLFILTTREYILQQGLARYGRFKEGKGIEVSKCTVDMGKYTRFVRAQILYNHLVASDIPQEYINAILTDKNYLKIIDHPHFSPRIIETFISNGTHEQCEPDEYFNKIRGFFDHPDSVWLDAFGRLSVIEKEALLVLTTMGTPTMFTFWKEAYRFFFEQVHKERNYLNDIEWNNTVKVLQNNFIRVENDRHGMYVEFHNPGVRDVLTRYICSDDRMRMLLLNNAYYVEQVFGALIKDSQYNHLIEMSSQLQDGFYLTFERIWADYRSCRTLLHRASERELFYDHSPLSKAEALLRLKSRLVGFLQQHPYYVEKKMTQQVLTDNKADLFSLLTLLKSVELSQTNLDLEGLFHDYTFHLYCVDNCLDFARSLAVLFPSHVDYLESEEFCEIAAECLEQELRYTKDSELEALESTVDSLCNYIPCLESETIVSELKDRKDAYINYVEAQGEAYQDDYPYLRAFSGAEDRRIDDLFATIKG